MKLESEVILNEHNSTYCETMALCLTFESCLKIQNVCNYLLCLRDDSIGKIYWLDDFDSWLTVEDFYRVIYRGKPYRRRMPKWREIELKPDAEFYELH